MERIARVLQGKTSNYDTDLFAPIFEGVRKATGAEPYGGRFDNPVDTAYRVIADHLRALSFAIADGAEPSNEGRGYVLRRILRRAVRFGRQTLGVERPFFASLVPVLVDVMGDAFPEVRKRSEHIEAVLLDEEKSFHRTLDHGIALFERAAEGGGGISAEDAFKLYDTHGFPIDLTQLMAEERGLKVDTKGFERLMERARERSRAGAGGVDDPISRLTLGTEQIALLRSRGTKPTDDSRKYESSLGTATVRAIWNGNDWDETVVAGHDRVEELVAVVLNRTNFYAEAGGQISDTGAFRVTKESSPGVGVGTGGEFRVAYVKRCGDFVVHIGRCTKGELRVGDVVETKIDRNRRARTASNHTATHLLNHALRQVIGGDTDQKGSLVSDDRLRFDFNSARALEADEVGRLEEMVRERIVRDLKVHAGELPLETARSINGLRAVFGESYPDPVRVVSVGVPVGELAGEPAHSEWRRESVELCGGTHVGSTGEIGSFAVIAEENVAKGVRRIVALTGDRARSAERLADEVVRRLDSASSMKDDALAAELQEVTRIVDESELPVPAKAGLREKLGILTARVRSSEKAAAKAGREEAVNAAREIASSSAGRVIVAQMPGVGTDRGGLMSAMDAVTKKRDDAAVMLYGVDEAEGKVAIAAKVPESLFGRGLKAGDWVREAAAACGGKGGGRPDSAQGGGTDVGRLNESMQTAREFAEQALGDG